jgi:hypothetical protein
MTRLRTPFHSNPDPYSVNAPKPLWLASLILPLVAVLGCEKRDAIGTYSAPKEPPPVKPVEFAVPEGWRELRPQQMQYAAFAIDPQRSDASLTIVPLPRESNELAPNVNRWERELGLPPSSPEAVEKLVTHVARRCPRRHGRPDRHRRRQRHRRAPADAGRDGAERDADVVLQAQGPARSR